MENAADRCLRYLYNTATLGVAFDGSQEATMVAHSDSDWALRHSTTGYCITVACWWAHRVWEQTSALYRALIV
eukprot:scaffold395_cov133-Isochrysis_galbana.AAC.4